MDVLDRKALANLARNARMTWSELGKVLGLSAPAAADRVKKLEDGGVIRGYAALLDPEALGLPLLAFVAASLADQRKRGVFLKGIAKLPEIIECHHVTGDDDYFLKIRCKGTRDLDRVLVQELKEKLGVANTRTTIALATAKETVCLPVDE